MSWFQSEGQQKLVIRGCILILILIVAAILLHNKKGSISIGGGLIEITVNGELTKDSIHLNHFADSILPSQAKIIAGQLNNSLVKENEKLRDSINHVLEIIKGYQNKAQMLLKEYNEKGNYDSVKITSFLVAVRNFLSQDSNPGLYINYVEIVMKLISNEEIVQLTKSLNILEAKYITDSLSWKRIQQKMAISNSQKKQRIAACQSKLLIYDINLGADRIKRTDAQKESQNALLSRTKYNSHTNIGEINTQLFRDSAKALLYSDSVNYYLRALEP